MADKIEIRGARVHNLKNIDVAIPHNQLVVVTGLSGSGKSTLAFDTIFAEGRRRYVESLSAYARQFLGRLEKPDVDYIDGIAPAIAIEQKVSSRNPRSTVGTTTEIYDYLKLLYSRVGHTISPVSGREVRCYSTDDVVEYVLGLGEGSRVVVAAPLKLSEGQGIIEKLTLLLGEGIQRLWVDGATELIEDFLPNVTDETRAEDISVIFDRRRVSSDNDSITTLGDSISKAFAYGDRVCHIITDEVKVFSSEFEMDGLRFEPPHEHLFSFNNPLGACPVCEGYGRVVGIDENLVIPDKTKSVYEGAIVCWRGETMGWWRQQLVDAADVSGFPIHRPYYKLSRAEKRLLWTGCEWFHGLDEFFKSLESQRYKVQYRVLLSRYTGKTLCPECEGGRLRKEATYVKVGGRAITELVTMTVGELDRWFAELTLDEYDSGKATRIITEIRNRLRCLCDVGLEYLTLDRLSSTLSGGESQRINLSQQLGSCLVGSLYILDEPSIGLHPRDTDRLIKVLKGLRDLGNTVIVVEHDAEIMRAADRIIDMGPLAGVHGGEVVCNGTYDELMKCPQSLTSDYLSGRRVIGQGEHQPRGWSNSVLLRGVLEHNLKGFDVRIPLGVMTCVTGVSGSGKSSLVKGILYPALRRQLHESGDQPGELRELAGDVNLLTAVELVDQNPIGKSSRSNPVTYVKAYDEIRKLFAEQPFAKHTGMTPAFFSFNTPGGRCEECQGEGIIKVGMQFMADVELTCQACGGRRFKDEVLEVKYRDHNIFDVLEMSVDRAVEFFGEDKAARRIVERLKVLQDVGLGYVKLGQSSSTLSGGESQRVKLASFLLKESASERIMFIFDEPTTGLHFHDIDKLLGAFDALIRRGHSVVVVEHNMDVVKCADWVIDLGPEGGDAGGNLVFEGRPAELAECEKSYTARYLKQLMKK